MQMCLAHTNYNLLQPTFSTLKTLISKSLSKASLSQRPIDPPRETLPLLSLSKRVLGLSIFAVILKGVFTNIPNAFSGEEDFELERYTDSKEGFTLLRPSSWIKVPKINGCIYVDLVDLFIVFWEFMLIILVVYGYLQGG